MEETYTFLDRTEAGILLSKAIAERNIHPDLVMALPRGGVPVGLEIARSLDIPLYLFLVRKIGYPGNEEYAIGAVTENAVALSEVEKISPEYIQQRIRKERKRIAEMKRVFAQDWEASDCQGKHIVVVDDGIATGQCIQLAVSEIKKMKPKKITIAVPVGLARALLALQKQADDLIVLITPVSFAGIGAFYEDFGQLTDQEVTKMVLNHI